MSASPAFFSSAKAARGTSESAEAAEVTAARRVLRPSMRRASPDETTKAAMSVLYSIFRRWEVRRIWEQAFTR
jgi:hypothetical protein